MSSAPRCRGLTKAKRQCRRTVEKSGLFCWQHEEQKDKSEKGKKSNKSEKEEKEPKSKQSRAVNRKIPKPKTKISDEIKSNACPINPPLISVKENSFPHGKCVVEGCKRLTMTGSPACVTHTCHHKDCKENAQFGFIWCSLHKCPYPECRRHKTHGKPACLNHLCEKCDNMRVSMGTTFCQQHMCSIKGCKNCVDEKSEKKIDKMDMKTENKRYCTAHKKQYALEKPDECPICLEEFKNDEEPWPCGHYIHRSCITSSLKAECPLCRTTLKLRPEEERAINARSGQVVERNAEFLANLENRMLRRDLRLSPAYMQALHILANHHLHLLDAPRAH
jgi:hypothetical protein